MQHGTVRMSRYAGSDCVARSSGGGDCKDVWHDPERNELQDVARLLPQQPVLEVPRAVGSHAAPERGAVADPRAARLVARIRRAQPAHVELMDGYRSRSQLWFDANRGAERVPDDRFADVLHRSTQPQVLAARTILMRNQMNRARFAGAAAIVLAAGVSSIAGCDRVKNELLEPQNPGIVDSTAVLSPAAAAALKVGAIGRLKVLSNDPNATGFAWSSLWVASGLFTDEFSNSDFQNSQNDVDARTISPDNVVSDYSRITQSRGFVRDAIVAEKQWEPQKLTDIAELYLGLGFLEMSLAEDFCNGIPLGSSKQGQVDYSSPEFKPLTNQEVYAIALLHVDSAITTIGTLTDGASTFGRQT